MDTGRYRESARRKRNMGRVRELEKLSQDFNETKIIEKKSIDLVLNKTNESAVNVVEAFDISFAYDSNDNKKKIISNFSLKIQRNDRIGIIGANGTGKTTLIKILQGIYSPTIGRIKVGEHINLKYFDQNKESINLDSTPWRTMTESGDYVSNPREKWAATALSQDSKQLLSRDPGQSHFSGSGPIL